MMIEMANKITTRAAVGNKFEYQDKFLATLSEGVVLAGSTDLTDIFPSYSWLLSMVSQIKSRVERCHQKQDEILESIVQDHRKQEKVDGNSRGELTEDFVDVLLRLQKKGDFELSNDNIKALILDVFGAGSDTSSSTMQWTMSELMRNPRVMNKVQKEVRDALRGKSKVTEDDVKELNYLQLVIKETLRLHPPLPLLLPRECQKECELLGYKIPAKTRVVVNAWAIGRDPQYWEDAEEFKPERFERSMIDFRGTNFELLPFGAGRRMCPGILFGLATMVLPLAQLLYYFDWELPTAIKIKSESLDMSESFGITVHKKFDLLLHATPHISQTEN
ncbi:uncharacterized protein A4U43_C05F19210 [Asparagus officinalis]|uniref:Cytochrome P450 n=1 Tax=Asparagus officinalis TaxID=4686 RepID=A0A5P1ETU3_ASPOF|nr:premnaspirodiene oxygenase-like isoform X1 [Asparagus officinalis]XP_020263997.1 premnaspirodiene oxygenase-like isoform X2 [Asparagus officinalis]ONK69093.1 uncharacterized protein A4U43_C05F19210 [Asparagus officinalis]